MVTVNFTALQPQSEERDSKILLVGCGAQRAEWAYALLYRLNVSV